MILRTPSVISIRRVICVSLAPWLLSTILLALLATSALAQGETWQPIGPAGDQDCESVAAAVVPGANGGLYTAGRGCGVFYSEDGGVSWMNRGVGLPAGGVTALAAAPSQPARLYAGADRTIYRSDDGGRSWRKLSGFPSGSTGEDVDHIVVHPTNPDILYAVRGAFAFWGPLTYLYQSMDGGEIWTKIGSGKMNDIAFDPGDPRRVYVTDDTRILRSNDDGKIWEELTVDPRHPYPVERLHVAAGSIIYAAMGSGGGVYRSNDGGESWTAINEGLSDTFITALAGDPADPLVLYAAAYGGDILRYDAGSWTLLAAQEDTPFSAVNWLTLDSGADALPGLLAATSEGLFRSQDGVQWRLLSGDVQNLWVNVYDLAIRAGDPDEMWIAAGLDGVFSHGIQPDDSVVYPWVKRSSGLEGQRVLSLALDPQNSAILYAGTETNLFKSEDRGLSWRESDQGLEPPPLPTPHRAAAESTGLSVTALAVDPTDNNRVYAGTSQSLFISDDGGASWVANTDFADVPNWPLYPTIRQIAIAPSDPNTLYAVVRLGGREKHIFKSIDGGESWTIPAIGGTAMRAPGRLAIDPLDAETVYSVSEGDGYGGGVWKSEDGGHTWRMISPDDLGFMGSSIAIAGKETLTIAVTGMKRGPGEEKSHPAAYLSGDGGKRWLPIEGGLSAPLTILAFNPDEPAHLYAGTAGMSVMEADFGRRQAFLPTVFAR